MGSAWEAEVPWKTAEIESEHCSHSSKVPTGSWRRRGHGDHGFRCQHESCAFAVSAASRDDVPFTVNCLCVLHTRKDHAVCPTSSDICPPKVTQVPVEENTVSNVEQMGWNMLENTLFHSRPQDQEHSSPRLSGRCDITVWTPLYHFPTYFSLSFQMK